MKINWQTKNIEDCIDKIAYTNKIHRKDFMESGIFPVISQERDLINGYWNKKEDVFHVSKPVVVFGDHTQILKYIDFDFVLGADGVKLLQPKEFLYPKYLYYFLQSINLRNLGYARHYRLLKEKDITYPESIFEQKRIAKTLDEAFEKLEKVKQNTEKNLQNSKELFESYLNNVFSNIGKNWGDKKLGDFIRLEYGKPLPDSKRKQDGSYPIYGANGEKGRTNEFYFDNPSIIVGRKGTAGALNPTEDKFWPLDVTYFVTFDNLKYDLKFIYYLLSTLDLPSLARGVKPGINRNEVYSIGVTIPNSLKEQKQIVKKLDQLSENTHKLESLYKQKLESIEELKKSLLRRAFTGGL